MDRLTSRTPPSRSNRRSRRIQAAFANALWSKVRRCEREEAFAEKYAPLYEQYGERVRRADEAFFVNYDDAEVHIVDGRIVLVRGSDPE